MQRFFHALEARRLLSDSALSFDGTNDFLDIANPADHHLDLGENATVELKVNFKTLPAIGSKVTLISKGSEQSHWSLNYSRKEIEGIEISVLELEIITPTGSTAGGIGWDPVPNHWYHIAEVKSGQGYKDYFDGVSNDDGSASPGPPTTSSPLQVGGGGDAKHAFNGMIDEVRLWNTVRSAGDINANRNKHLNGTESGLVGYWDFDEPTDSQVALDRTSHHSDGRLGTTTGVDASDPTRVILSGGDGGGSIAGKLFNDANKNGILEAGDSLLASKKIYIDSNSNGRFDNGEISTLTNAGGEYHFSGLSPGAYRVGRADTPPGYTFSTPAGGFWNVTLSSGQAVTGKNFGVYQGTPTGGNNASISGFLFNDANKNGLIDGTDSLLSARKIYLDANGNGKFDAGERSTLTNVLGFYTFNDLPAGTYRVARADTPPGYSFSTPAAGFWSVTLASGQAAVEKNFGVSQGTVANTGSISGIVFSDSDKDGSFDPTETRLALKAIYIDMNKNGIFDTGDILDVSDTNGEYRFAGLAAGTYRIRRADVPTGYKLSVPSAGFYDITISANQTVSGKNIGAVPI